MIPSGRLNGYSVNTLRYVLVSSADADSTIVPNGTEVRNLRSSILLALPERGARHPSCTIPIHTYSMRSKQISYAQKRQRETFHIARYDPECWEQEKETTLLENLREARERANAAEREAETNKETLKYSQQQASIVIVCEDKLPAHGTEKRLTICRRDWRHLKTRGKVYVRPVRWSLMNSQTRARLWRRCPTIT